MSNQGCVVCKLVGALVIIGALNWGAIGILQTDFVAALLGEMTTASRVVYSLVGIAGLLKLISCFKACPCVCKKT
ncbi:MAG: DUF378 domain-containing protein [Candidatus Omnitrophica bacterium]|nr:DUF378 domain-containing protein [Candidatus Omnitrophota bacterium]